MISRAILSALAASLMLGGAAFAQQPAAAPSQPQLSPAETGFIKDAAIDGEFEVQSGRLAQRNAANAMVKEFGMRMVQEHQNVAADLTTIAKSKGVPLPRSLDRPHAQLLNRLAVLQGGRFDREYITAMVKDHDEDTQKFANEADNGKDEDLRRFARNTLNTIKQHDEVAHEIARSMDLAVGSSSP